MYIDRLLDSSLPHNLIQEYNQPRSNIPHTISEESSTSPSPNAESSDATVHEPETEAPKKVKRTPKNLYRLPNEEQPLLQEDSQGHDNEHKSVPPLEMEDEEDSQSRIVGVAISVNMVANTILLILKIIVTILTSSVSVLASLVDAVLDFLSTAIVWTTTKLSSRKDQYSYPVGRRRLEPIGVLVFSVIMITSFFQVALEGFNRLMGEDHSIIQLTISAIAIMATTVVVKGLCWVWCRLIKNSSVQMLAEDAKTDVVFNTASIVFPLGRWSEMWRVFGR